MIVRQLTWTPLCFCIAIKSHETRKFEMSCHRCIRNNESKYFAQYSLQKSTCLENTLYLASRSTRVIQVFMISYRQLERIIITYYRTKQGIQSRNPTDCSNLYHSKTELRQLRNHTLKKIWVKGLLTLSFTVGLINGRCLWNRLNIAPLRKLS